MGGSRTSQEITGRPASPSVGTVTPSRNRNGPPGPKQEGLMTRTTVSRHSATTPPSRIPIEYVSVKEAATFTNLSKATLDSMRQRGIGPAFVKISERRVVYELSVLRDYIAARRVNPSSV